MTIATTLTASRIRSSCPTSDCTQCTTLRELTYAARWLNVISHTLTSAGLRADGPDTDLDAALAVVSDRIGYQMRVWINAARECALDDVLDAPTMEAANNAANRFGRMFPHELDELRARMADGTF